MKAQPKGPQAGMRMVHRTCALRACLRASSSCCWADGPWLASAPRYGTISEPPPAAIGAMGLFGVPAPAVISACIRSGNVKWADSKTWQLLSACNGPGGQAFDDASPGAGWLPSSLGADAIPTMHADFTPDEREHRPRAELLTTTAAESTVPSLNEPVCMHRRCARRLAASACARYDA